MHSKKWTIFTSKCGEGETDAGFTKNLQILRGYMNLHAPAHSSNIMMAGTILHWNRCKRAPLLKRSFALKMENFSYGFGQELITSLI